ncbi:MAG: SDR family oxidoreductase [Deltaproteobacteria bacterium]|nr:SDR family oxidoreductase [Deltaproteobacteria bacterium]
MVNLNGQVVLVTGASSGIGKALAGMCSEAGAKVALTARRPDRLEETAAGCSGETLVLPGDLVAEDHRKALADQCIKRWGRIDILINSAGLGMYGDFLSSTEALWRRLFEINLFSTVFLTREVLPHMQDRNQGLIVNIASIGGLIAHSGNVTPYVASKHAVVGFSRGLAMDLKGSGIRVLAVCPHLTSTEFFEVSPGAEEMAPEVEKYKTFMDSPKAVARGIINQLDSERLVVFPTEKPATAYEKQRDL